MNLDQLLKLENISNYQVWWYGKDIAKFYLGEEKYLKPYVSFKGKKPDLNKIYILLYGIDGHKSKYMYSLKLTEQIEEELIPGEISYKFERIFIKLDKYSNRLILKNKFRQSLYNNSGENFEVEEIYPPKMNRNVMYFKSYDDVELTFAELKEIYDNQYNDYYKHLSCVKAIYMIIDSNTGKQYIGSAYGKEGLFGRWKEYVDTFHGNNDELIELFNLNGVDYFKNFKFIILQVLPLKISDKEIIDIETKYKNRFLTKVCGLNRN